MDIGASLQWLEASALATRIRDSLYLFPFLESIHVIGLALVFGTIGVIDLRLLGAASTERPFKRMASDILKWTWVAFVLAALTGTLMFITNATVYYHNSFFRIKMVLLALSGCPPRPNRIGSGFCVCEASSRMIRLRSLAA